MKYTINDNHFIHVSRLLPCDKARLIETVLNKVKRMRKNTPKESHSDEGLNIFLKKAITMETLLNEFKEKKWMIENFKGEIHLTEEGEEKFELCMTDGMSKEFLAYYREIKEVLKGMPPVKYRMLLSFFRDKVESKHLLPSLKGPSGGTKKRKYHEKQIRDLTGNEYDPEKYYFHFTPELFAMCMHDYPVRFEIEGIEAPKDFVVESPYPNKYYHAVRSSKSKQSLLGWYPLVGEKECFEKPFHVKMTWYLDEMKIEHHLTVHFAFDSYEKGNFFFLNQRNVLGYLDFPSVNAKTFLPDDNSGLSKNRDVDVEKNEGNHIILNEIITLSAMPVEHSMSPNDVSFSKFEYK